MLSEQNARKLVAELRKAGANCGLLAVQGSLVMRGPGAPWSDTPMVSYDENVLLDAVALRLLEKQQMNVNGKPGWEWYVLRTPKRGEWAILLDGTRKQIEDKEQGIAFFGKGDHDLAPFENMVPVADEPDCWRVHPREPDSEGLMDLKVGQAVRVWTSGAWAPGWRFVKSTGDQVLVENGGSHTQVPRSHIAELIESELAEAKRRAVRICKEKGKSSYECKGAALDVSRLQGLVDALPMPKFNFGVCVSHSDNCELSSERPSLDDLPRRIAVAEAQGSRGIDSQLTKSSLAHFLPFFQTGPFCSKCKGPLEFVTQPAAGLSEDSDERRRIESINRLLDAGSKLQAMGILPL